MKTKVTYYESPEVSVMEAEILTEGILCASDSKFSGNGFEYYEEDLSWS